MEFDEIENFLAGERERRKTDREREIENELNAIAVKHREALVAECEPLYKELARIDACKPPMPIVVDGKIYEYTGPSR
jgi:hypothetical protein